MIGEETARAAAMANTLLQKIAQQMHRSSVACGVSLPIARLVSLRVYAGGAGVSIDLQTALCPRIRWALPVEAGRACSLHRNLRLSIGGRMLYYYAVVGRKPCDIDDACLVSF